MIRIKIKCREPTKVPKKRVMEMRDGIYLIKFKTKGIDQESDSEEGGDGKGGKPEEDGNPAEQDLLDGDLGKNDDDLPLEMITQKKRKGAKVRLVGRILGLEARALSEEVKWLGICSAI
jgi:hypothetical protein